MSVTPGSRRDDLPAPESRDGEDPRNLRDLFLLSMAMFDGRDEGEVLRVALEAVAGLCPARAEAGYLRTEGTWVRAPDPGDDVSGRSVDEQIRGLRGQDGPVTVPGRAWGRAVALRSPRTTIGYLVVSAPARPDENGRFLIDALARQTSAALTNAAARRAEREHAAELRRANAERARANARLSESVEELEFQKSVHEALGQATVESEEGIAHMVRAFTGLPVAIEDPFGNLRVWAGPGRPSR